MRGPESRQKPREMCDFCLPASFFAFKCSIRSIKNGSSCCRSVFQNIKNSLQPVKTAFFKKITKSAADRLDSRWKTLYTKIVFMSIKRKKIIFTMEARFRHAAGSNEDDQA